MPEDGLEKREVRIVHVSNSLSRTAGGLYYSVSGLVKAQRAAGIDAVALGGADEFFAGDRHQWGDAPTAAYPARNRYGLSWTAFREIVRLRPDLLHVHGIWAATSMYARFAQHVGIPVVVSPRGMLDPWILARKRLVKGIHAGVLERPVLRKGYVHALNQSERQSVLAFDHIAEDRVRVFPNGIEDKVLPRVARRRRGFLYLGRLHPKKQVRELVAAWVAGVVPEEEPLLVAGWGDAAYEAEVREAAKGSAKVRFLGPLYGEPKTEALLGARAFILPSLSEGLPMAVLEALQHGCLPIITSGCNLPELFADGVALRLEADLSNLGEVVARAAVISDDDLVVQAKALSSYSRRFLWAEIATAMSGWYRAILSNHKSRPLWGARA